MADFEKLVGQDDAVRNREPEIVKELADHLEELYIDLCAAGISEVAAYAQVAKIGAGLGPTLRRLRWLQQGGAISILRSAMIPGLVGCLLYEAVSTAIFNGNALRAEPGVIEPYGWVALLSIGVGVAVSSLSRALGGSERRRMVAALFPAGVHFAGWFVMGVLGTSYQLLHLPSTASARVEGIVISLLWVLFYDVLLPAAALASGALMAARYFPVSTESLWRRLAA